MKKLESKNIKQVLLISFACLLFIIGYMNNNSNIEEVGTQASIVSNENEDMIGDVQLVNSNVIIEENTVSAIVGNDEIEVSNNKDDNEYFEATRIERDAMYSRMLENYNKILNNDKLPETQKAIAVKEIEKLTNNQNAIMITENLVKNKGFEDVVVLANSDIVNVVVKSAFLNNEDIVKIQSIVEREFSVSIENINISNKN